MDSESEDHFPTIAEAIRRMRDLINEPRRQYSLLQNRPAWFRLCSSLDVVCDCDLAIEAYRSAALPDEPGMLYLATYGCLQALFIQQDAVRDLCASLGVPFKPHDDPVLKAIREIRNASVGHPTSNKRNPEGRPYHFISFPTMRQGSFTLLSAGTDADQFRPIDCLKLIDQQEQCLRRTLSLAIEHLEREEMEHRKRFAGKLLADHFDMVNHYLGKVFEGINRPADYGELPSSMLDLIDAALSAFRDALEARGSGIDTYVGTKDAFEQTKRPFARLRAFFDGTESVDSTDAYIFACHLRAQLDGIREVAAAIDAEYAKG